MKANVSNTIYWILSGLFLSVYFWIIYQHIYNIPILDDFVFFSFLCDYIDSSSFTEKFNLVFSQHNEHRLVFMQIIVLLSYWLTGKINITAFIIIGNLFLFGIGFMFFVFFRQKKNMGLLVLLIVLLLFNGQNFETSAWAMVGLANTGTLLLAMLSIYFVMQSGKGYFITGLVLSVITIFSNGNGMCLLPAVLLSFLLEKKKKELIVFAVVGGMAVMAYFFHWKPGSAWEFLGIGNIVMGFFLFLGGNFWWPTAKIIPLLVGVFIFVTYIIALAGKFYQKNRLWFTFFTFVLSMAAMVSFNRVVDFIPLRYRIYCCMGILLTVMFYFENREVFHLSRWFKFILPLVMLFSIINSLLYLDKRERDTESLKISACNWQRNRSYFYYFPTLDGSDILKKAEAAGIYFMPEFPMEKIASTVEITGEKWQNRHSTISYYIEFVEETNGYVLIKGWAWPAEISAFVMEDFADIRLWLFNEECHILIHPYLEKRFDFTNRQTGGFFAIIPRAKCPQGIYKLGIEMQKRYIFPVKSSATSIETEAIVMF